MLKISFRQPAVHWHPFSENPCTQIFIEIRHPGRHFAADSTGLSSFKFTGMGLLQQRNAIERVTAIQGHPRLLISVPIVSGHAMTFYVNGNLGPILRHFGNMLTSRSKIANLPETFRLSG